MNQIIMSLVFNISVFENKRVTFYFEKFNALTTTASFLQRLKVINNEASLRINDNRIKIEAAQKKDVHGLPCGLNVKMYNLIWFGENILR